MSGSNRVQAHIATINRYSLLKLVAAIPQQTPAVHVVAG